MRIGIITLNFLPEMGALSNRMYPIAEALAAAGHEVYVMAGIPNYRSSGMVFEGYRRKLFMKERFSNYTVLRSAYYTVPRNQSRWLQALSYLSFAPGAFCNGLRVGRLDVVLATSPPIFTSLAAMLLAFLYRAKFVFDIRDLWPDEIVAFGAVTDRSLAVRAVKALERRVYRRADLICCTTRPFVETVVERGAKADKTKYLPNGADTDVFHPLAASNPVAARFGFQDRFVVMYTGALGIKHGLQTILEVARMLEDEPDIVFAFVGGGARESELRQRAERMQLKNIVFLGEQQVTDVPFLIARANVCISSLLPSPYLEKIVSVKIYEYLACGKPVIGLHSGETARVLNESGAALVVKPGDTEGCAQAVLKLYRDPELCARLGSRGCGYIEQNFSRRAIAMRLNALLNFPSSGDAGSRMSVAEQARLE